MNCPVGSSSVSCSPWHWRPIRICWCWTSQRRGSTPRSKPRCSISFRNCEPNSMRPFFSSAITWALSRECAKGWACSTPGDWSRRGRREIYSRIPGTRIRWAFCAACPVRACARTPARLIRYRVRCRPSGSRHRVASMPLAALLCARDADRKSRPAFRRATSASADASIMTRYRRFQPIPSARGARPQRDPPTYAPAHRKSAQDLWRTATTRWRRSPTSRSNWRQAKFSASSASPAVASRRWPNASSAWSRYRGARSDSTAPISPDRRIGASRICGARCKWCSRTRTPRSTQAIR